MSLACYCNSHHHFRADHPVAGCLVSGCDCQAMSGGPAERAREITPFCTAPTCQVDTGFVCANHAAVAAALAAQAAELDDAQFAARAAQQTLTAYAAKYEQEAAQTRALRETLEERAAMACKKACGWSRTMVGGALEHTPLHTPECERARAALPGYFAQQAPKISAFLGAAPSCPKTHFHAERG